MIRQDVLRESSRIRNNNEGPLRSQLYGAKEKHLISLNRAVELKGRIKGYLEARKHIPTGFANWPEIEARQHSLMQFFNATPEEFADWRWQMQHRINDPTLLGQLLNLSPQEEADIMKVGQKFRWAISPYYLSLINPAAPDDPVRRQALPSIMEIISNQGEDDPMAEEFTSPAPAITRRYPDRLIINVTNQCAMYCRHCQRRRNIGEVDRHKPMDDLRAALNYIRQNEEVRDVLITGGDALLLSEKRLDWLLGELDAIPHVEMKRLGTRVPVTMPQRITDELCAVLAKHPPIYLNTQFNHPLEVTPAAAAACDRLIKAGVVLGNQAVLLKGVNNNRHVMKKLNQELLRIRVRPYYIFHAKSVVGTSHFITRVEEGLEIMEHLRGYTSGLAVPTYIINAPDGLGKTPILPRYLISVGPDKLMLRTWEKRVLEYPNHEGVEC